MPPRFLLPYTWEELQTHDSQMEPLFSVGILMRYSQKPLEDVTYSLLGFDDYVEDTLKLLPFSVRPSRTAAGVGCVCGVRCAAPRGGGGGGGASAVWEWLTPAR